MVAARVLKEKLIAIVRGMEAEAVLPLAEALYAGGIRLIEVTFDLRSEKQDATTQAIRAIKSHFGMDVSVGAGTVISPALVDLAYEAGAEYIISPNVEEAVISHTKALGLISMPGALTPSECLAAHNAGADFIKLFPATAMGPAYLKAITAPLSHMKFLAVGGIDEKNITAFKKAGAVGFGVGGNLVNKEWIQERAWGRITDLARVMVDLCKDEGN